MDTTNAFQRDLFGVFLQELDAVMSARWFRVISGQNETVHPAGPDRATTSSKGQPSPIRPLSSLFGRSHDTVNLMLLSLGLLRRKGSSLLVATDKWSKLQAEFYLNSDINPTLVRAECLSSNQNRIWVLRIGEFRSGQAPFNCIDQALGRAVVRDLPRLAYHTNTFWAEFISHSNSSEMLELLGESLTQEQEEDDDSECETSGDSAAEAAEEVGDPQAATAVLTPAKAKSRAEQAVITEFTPRNLPVVLKGGNHKELQWIFTPSLRKPESLR